MQEQFEYIKVCGNVALFINYGCIAFTCSHTDFHEFLIRNSLKLASSLTFGTENGRKSKYIGPFFGKDKIFFVGLFVNFGYRDVIFW